MAVLTVLLIVPEFYVLLAPKSTRACDTPLFQILVASIIFVFFMAGKSIVLNTLTTFNCKNNIYAKMRPFRFYTHPFINGHST